MKRFPNFKLATIHARQLLKETGHVVPATYWQGVDISKKPEMVSHEVFNFNFTAPLSTERLDFWREDIQPNLPWADEHFELERVSGHPINPGETWKSWPYGHTAANFVGRNGQFNHSYAERYWPKYAGQFPGGGGRVPRTGAHDPHKGIRYVYADLNDLIHVLCEDPQTRQAYLPVWFPEDGSHMDRKPCSLGYHFLMRAGFFHVNYYIRSCDIIRHFQDDIYLTVRLHLWILNQLRAVDERWKKIMPGHFSMYITSLHCFANDFKIL